MRKVSQTAVIDRITDANINRAKEGLRVCEEIARFILNSRQLTAGFKRIRHQLTIPLKDLSLQKILIKARQSECDIGRHIYINELKRRNYRDIFFANIQRVKESVRVLEEFAKLKNSAAAVKFKEIRYNLYVLEKKVAEKILPLRHHR